MLFLHGVHQRFMMFDILYLSFGLPAGTLFSLILLKHKARSAQEVPKHKIYSI